MGHCLGCHTGCCRAFAVPVSGADILRIMSATGQTFREVACRWEDPQGEIDRGHAPHFHFADDPETPYVICLLHEPSDSFPGTTRCKFIHELPPAEGQQSGASQCSIYTDRPGTCRVFPAKSDDLVQIDLQTVPEYGRAEQQPAYKLCPVQWQLTDLNPFEILQEIRCTTEEMQLFRLVARM